MMSSLFSLHVQKSVFFGISSFTLKYVSKTLYSQIVQFLEKNQDLTN